MLDSDVNDPQQQARVSNNTAATAQPIASSSQVVGYVNMPGTGSPGASYVSGDDEDWFRATLNAGQVLTLDFAADPAANDLDLYVFNATTGALVGQSFGQGRTECVRITTAGDYHVVVQAYAGASVYGLRAAAASTAGTCSNATTSATSIVAGELIAKAAASTASVDMPARARALSAQGSMRIARGSLDGGRVALLGLPSVAGTRAQALGSLQTADTDLRRRAAAVSATTSTTARTRQSRAGLSEATLAQLDTIAYAKAMRRTGAYEYVMLNRTLEASALVGLLPSNDTRYPLQRWHYEQISLPGAMQALVGMANQPSVRPIVAIVDTGIVADHPDLSPQVIPGYDFISSAASAGDGNGIDPNPDDSSVRADLPSFHGTHVAGTAAAAGFNGEGGTGVAPMAQIMPLRVLGKDGSGSLYDITQALLYATRQTNDSGSVPARRADVINLSLGFRSSLACDTDSQRFFDGIRATGAVMVAATGNDSNRSNGVLAPVSFPANCSGVIAVTATDPQRAIAPYANTGAQTVVAAPGGDQSRSTTGTGLPDGVYSTVATFDSSGNRIASYGTLQGTSMATPHVSGVIALMRWVHPAISPAEIDALFAQGALTDDVGATGRDSLYGWGVINARKAVEAAIALKNGTPVVLPAGLIEAQPSELGFGTSSVALEFLLRATGSTSEIVRGIATSSPAVSVRASAIDSVTGLGTYRVSVDRSQLPVGPNALTVTVTTSTRTVTLTVSVDKPAAGSAVALPNLGPMYVLVLDAATDAVLAQTTALASGGRYAYVISGVSATSVKVIAGSDLDNDQYICNRGEGCGAYPVLGAQVTPITLTGNRSDLNFTVAPVSTGLAGSASTGSGADTAGSGGWRRR